MPSLLLALWTAGKPSWPLPFVGFQLRGRKETPQEERMASIWLFGLSECALAGKSGARDLAKRQQQAGIVRGGDEGKVWVGLRLREEAWPLPVVTTAPS